MYFENFSNKDTDTNSSIRNTIESYFRHYKWFVASGLLFLVLSFVFVRTLVPRYSISASILIKESSEGKSIDDISSFDNLGLFGTEDRTLENEVQILKSRKLMEKVVEELNLNILYFLEDSPFDKELYNNIPFLVQVDSGGVDANSISTEVKVFLKSNYSFDLTDNSGKILSDLRFGESFEVNVAADGDPPIFAKIRFESSGILDEAFIGSAILVKILPKNMVLDYYMTKVQVEMINEKLSRVLSITMEENVVDKGIAIVNNLIEQYNADGIEDKHSVSQATTDFLDFRIDLISNELIAIEGAAEQFRSKNRMVGVDQNASIYLQSSSQNERELVAANTQLQLITYMLDELDKTDNTSLLPGNIGLSDIGIVSLINEYNELVLQRNRVLKSSSVRNPVIIGIDSQLDALKSNLSNSLSSLKSSTEIQINALTSQSGKLSSRIATVPKNEREYNDIVRQLETKNAIYVFLLQKREESILSDAVDIDKAKVIDTAYSTGRPVFPKKSIIYLAALVLGLALPFLAIYLSKLLDTKVRNEKDLLSTGVPYLGDIPLSTSKSEKFIKKIDNSIIAEAFRFIRTNIYFMLDNKETCKSILVTSTKAGEGKSFVAINLASSLAVSGKKTLLVEMDLRAPTLRKSMKLEEELGITNYIKNENLTLEQITEKHHELSQLDVINSGTIPPNPVELLMNPRVVELFQNAKSVYEYIIIDTAPVGMVTDTMQISRFSDLSLYVVKSNFLDKRMLHIPSKMYKENKLPNMAILINGSEHGKGAYGYGYGYGTKKKNRFFGKVLERL